jgi:hypothetical protein
MSCLVCSSVLGIIDMHGAALGTDGARSFRESALSITAGIDHASVQADGARL